MFINRNDANQIVQDIFELLRQKGLIGEVLPGDEMQVVNLIWQRGGLTWNGIKWVEETAEIVEPVDKAKSVSRIKLRRFAK